MQEPHGVRYSGLAVHNAVPLTEMVYYMEPVYFFFKMIQIFIYTNVHSLLKIYVHNPISLNTSKKPSQ